MTGIVAAASAAAASFIGVFLEDHDVSNLFTVDPFDASAGIKVLTNGALQTGSNNSSSNPTYTSETDEWAVPQTTNVGANFEVQLTTVSGSLSAGSDSADTWLALTSDREFKVAETGIGTTSFSGTLKIRRVGESGDGTTCTISLTATVDADV